MGENTKIEWCDSTFNAWIGCTKISPACDNCYAENLGGRLGVAWGPGMSRHLTSAGYWAQPKKWNKRCELAGTRERVFTNSLADVFDNEVPDVWRERLFDLIHETPHLDWLVLTKRVGNVMKMLPPDWAHRCPNVWLGISVVTQAEVDRDVPKLVSIRAAKRFLSVEPMLERINLCDTFGIWWNRTMQCWEGTGSRINFDAWGKKKIDWVICGGESGHRARPMDYHWPMGLRAQCKGGNAAFFMKQGSQKNWLNFKDFSGFPVDLQVREFPS